MDQEHYRTLIETEGRVWGNAASEMARAVRPDWQDMKRTVHYAALDAPNIERLLDMVQPGMRVLEIGCSSGWLSLEMARRGAHVEGVDVAAEAIQIAQKYAATNPPRGSVRYEVMDINYTPLPASTYDLIVAVGVLHHLVEVQAVMERVRGALRPGGRLYVKDALDTPRANALIAGGLSMLLPTQLSYPEKFYHLFRLRGRALAHMKDSIEAKGLSPFEGFGRHQDPVAVVRSLFDVTAYHEYSAFTGYVVAQLRLPYRAIVGLGRVLRLIDSGLTRLHLLRGLMYKLVARLPQEKRVQ